jgi:predicted short-subunit dehydrogenase-like oxidoreductase (DUF2520 family)
LNALFEAGKQNSSGWGLVKNRCTLAPNFSDMDLVIIGSGNVADCFGRLWRLKGHRITQVLSRNEAHARELAESLHAAWSDDMGDIDRDADLYLLAVSDTAIAALDRRLRLGSRPVVHTAGAVSLEAISHISAHTGVFYPLQSIRKGIAVNGAIPLLIEASDETVLKKLLTLAEAIPGDATVMSSADRLKMHLVAVFCNNFPNHLMTLCRKYCSDASLDFSLLQPLVRETFERLEAFDPEDIQTGPAIRADSITLQKHRTLLARYPEMEKVYNLLNESIEKYYRG